MTTGEGGVRELGRSMYAATLDAALHSYAALARLSRRLDFEAQGVRATRDVVYAPRDACRLDVYTPSARARAPVVLYVHGGGFQVGSRRSHEGVAMPFLRAGLAVVVIDYRLSPRHAFPAAVDDVCDAYRWLVEHADEHALDAARIVVAGESAGANLALALGIAATSPFALPSARAVFDLGVVPRAIVPMCGFLMGTDPERFVRSAAQRGERIHPWIVDRMRAVSARYMRGADATHGLELADPLAVLESESPLERAVPPMFVSCGGADPVLDDSRRLATALARRGIAHELLVEPGRGHAYQAFVLTRAAEQHWDVALRFVERALAPRDGERSEPGAILEHTRRDELDPHRHL